MMLHSLLLFFCLAVPGNDLTLADFQNSSPWQVSYDEGNLLKTSTQNGQKALRLTVPFAEHPDWERVYIDLPVQLDLSSAHRFILDVEPNNLEPLGAVTLYFRSKDGWYSCYGGFGRQGRQKLTFRKEDYRPEGTPAGWDQVDRIRIAFWQGLPQDGHITLYRLSVPKSPVLIVAGSVAEKDPDSKEAKETADRANLFQRLVSNGSMEADLANEVDLANLDLADYQVVVLPYNPKLLPEARTALIHYVENGGKLFVCYTLDPKLGQAIGFEPGSWMKAPREGGFASIHFTPTEADQKTPKIPGLPEMVQQNSWNINQAKPAGYHARVVGTWFDDAGTSTGETALLLSDRGAYLSHVVLPDDRENKAAMLTAILGKLSPSLWQDLAEAELEKLVDVGHDGPEQTEAWIQSRAIPQAVAELQKSRRLAIQSQRALDANACYRALGLAREALQARQQAYLLSQQKPQPGQRRGFWNHSGTGSYPGDWDRTMRELSDAGLNAIFPNMCWGGCAHYASDVLPRSDTYEEYGDQIAQAVEAGKKYGVEVHVWKVNHNLSHRTPPEFIEKLRQEGRLMKSAQGEELEWLCPSHPKNFELERDAMLEIPQKYDVDGVHFDYIRYHSDDYCYCDGCRERFEAASGKKVENWPQDCFSGSRKEEYRDWRCGNITQLVKAVHDGVQTINPKVQVSAAVFSNYPSCRTSIGQDWLLWAKSGYVDFLCPMDYQQNELSFENLVARQMKQVDGAVPLCPGIGASTAQPPMSAEQTATQIFLTERLGAGGFTIFNLSAGEAQRLLPGLGAWKEQEANAPYRENAPK